MPMRASGREELPPLDGSWSVKMVFTGPRLRSFMGVVLPRRRGDRGEHNFPMKPCPQIGRKPTWGDRPLSRIPSTGGGRWGQDPLLPLRVLSRLLRGSPSCGPRVCRCLAAKLCEGYSEEIDCRQGLTKIRTRWCKEHKDLDRFAPPERNTLRPVWWLVLLYVIVYFGGVPAHPYIV